MKVTYSPEVAAIIRKRHRRALKVSKSAAWLVIYLLILLAWVALP